MLNIDFNEYLQVVMALILDNDNRRTSITKSRQLTVTGPKSTGEVLETIQSSPRKTETTTDVLSHLGVDLTALLGSLTDAKKHHIPKFMKKNEYIDDSNFTIDDRVNFIKQGKVDLVDNDQTQLAKLEKYKLLTANLNKRSKTDTKRQNISSDKHLPVTPTINHYSPLYNFLSGTRSISESPIFIRTKGRKPKTKRNPTYEKILTENDEKEEPAVRNPSELQIQETNNETNLVSNETEVELTANETGPLFRYAKSDNKSTKKNYKKLTHPRTTIPLVTQRSASTLPLESGNTEDEDLLLKSLGENSVKGDIPNMESKTSDSETKQKDSEIFYFENLKRDEIPRAFGIPSSNESIKSTFVHNISDVTNLKSSSTSQELVSTAGIQNLSETLLQIESSTLTSTPTSTSRQISNTTPYQTDFEITSLYTTFSSLASKVLDFLPTTRLLLPTIPLTKNIHPSKRTILKTSDEIHRTKMILLKPTKVDNHFLTSSGFSRQQSEKDFSTSKIIAQPSLISPSQARLSLSDIKITSTPYRTTPLISTLNPHLKTVATISNTQKHSLKLETTLYSRLRGSTVKTTKNFRPTDSHSILLTKTVITKATVTSKMTEKLTQSSSDEELTSDQPVFNTNDDYLNKEPWTKLYNNKDWTSLPNAENNAVNKEDVKQARQIISSQKMDLVDKIIAYEKLKAQCKATFDIYENQHLGTQYKSRVSFSRGHVQSTEECIKACCKTSDCTVAYLRGKLCFSVTCLDEKSCKPVENSPNSEPSLLIYLTKNANNEQSETKYPILTMKDPSLNPMWNPYTDSQDSDICRRYRVQKNKVLKDGWDAGEYRKFRYIKSIYRCEQKCCEWAECNVALIINHCFTLKCSTAESCLPVEPDISFFKPKLSFIRTPNSSWLLPLKINSTIPNEVDISEYKEKQNKAANNSHTAENKTIHSANTMQRLIQASSKTAAYPKNVYTSKELDVLPDIVNLKSSSYTQGFKTVPLQEIASISTSLLESKTIPPTSGQDILKLLFETSSTKNEPSTESFIVEPHKIRSEMPTKSSLIKASTTISSAFLVSQVLSFFNSEPTINQNFSSEVLFLNTIKPSISDKDYYSSSSKSYWKTNVNVGTKPLNLSNAIYVNEYPRTNPEEIGSKYDIFFNENIGKNGNRYTTTEKPTRNNLKTGTKEEMGETRERGSKNYDNQKSRLTTPRKFKTTNVQYSKTTATPSGERDLKLLEEMMKFNDGDANEGNSKPYGITNQPLHQMNISPYMPFVVLSQNHSSKNKASQKSKNQSIKSKLQLQNQDFREKEKAGFGMLGSDGPIDERGTTSSSPLHHNVPQLSIVTDDDTFILPPDKIMSIDGPTSRPYTTPLDPKYRGTLNPKYLDKSYFPQKVYYPVYNANSASGTKSPLITSKPQRPEAVSDDNQPIIIPEFDEIKDNTSEKHTFKGNASNEPTSKSIVTSLKILQELDNLSNGKMKQDKDKSESSISELQSTKTEVGETHNEIPAVSTTKTPFIFYVKGLSTTSISRDSPFTTTKPATIKPVQSLNSTTSLFPHLASSPVNITYGNDSLIFNHTLTKETRVTDKNDTLCKNVRFFNASLRYGIKSGKFFDAGNVEDFDTCIKKCCQKVECNIAYMLKTRCYLVICSNLERCSPISSKSLYFQPRFAYVLKTEDFSKAVSYVMDQINLTYKSHKPTKLSSTGKSLKNTTPITSILEETKMGEVNIIKPNLKTTDQILPNITPDLYHFFNKKSVKKTISLSRSKILSTKSIALKSNHDVKPSSSFYINKIDISSASADLSAFFVVMSSSIANQNQSVAKNLQVSTFEEKAAVRQAGSQNTENKTNDPKLKVSSDINKLIHNGFKRIEDSNDSKLKLLLKTLKAVSNDLQKIQSKKDVDEGKISNLIEPLFKNLNETQALLLQKVLKLEDKSKDSFDNASMHEIIASIIKNIRETNKEIYPSQVPSLIVSLTENKNNATSSIDMSTKVVLQSTPSQKTWKTSTSTLQVVNLTEFVDKEIQRLEHGIIHPSTSFVKIVSNQERSSQRTEKLRWSAIPSTININSITSSSFSQILVPWTLTVTNNNREKEHQNTVNFDKTPKQSTKISNDNRDGSINGEKMAHNFGGKPINSALLHDDIASSFVENIKPSDTDDAKEEDENMNHYEQELENEEKPDQSETNQDDDGLREPQELASNSADDQHEKEQRIPTSFPSKEQKPSKFTSTNVLNTAEETTENPTKLTNFPTSRTTTAKPHITESYPHEKIIKALLSDREAQQKLIEALTMEKEALRGKTVGPTTKKDDDTSNQQKEKETVKEGAIQKSSATNGLDQEDLNLQKYHAKETWPEVDNPTAKQVERTSSENVSHEEDSHQNIDVSQDNTDIDNKFQEHQQTSTDTSKEQRLTEEEAEKLHEEEEIIKKEEEIQNKKAERRMAGLVMKMEKFVSEVQHVYRILKQRSLNSLSEDERKFQEAIHEEIKSWNISSTVKHMENQVLEFANHVSENRQEDFVKPLLTQLTNIMANLTNIEREKWSQPKPAKPTPQINDPYDLGTNIYKKQIVTKRKEHHRKSNEVMQKLYKLLRKKFDTLSKKVEAKFQFQTKTFQKVQKAIEKNWQDYRRLDQISNDLKKLESQKDVNRNTYSQNTRNIVSALMTTPTTTKKTKKTSIKKSVVTTNNKNTTSATKTTATRLGAPSTLPRTTTPPIMKRTTIKTTRVSKTAVTKTASKPTLMTLLKHITVPKPSHSFTEVQLLKKSLVDEMNNAKTTNDQLCDHTSPVEGYSLSNNLTEGIFYQGLLPSFDICIDECCKRNQCDVAFMIKNYCLLIKCKTLDYCRLKRINEEKHQPQLVSVMMRYIARKEFLGISQINPTIKFPVTESASTFSSQHYPMESKKGSNFTYQQLGMKKSVIVHKPQYHFLKNLKHDDEILDQLKTNVPQVQLINDVSANELFDHKESSNKNKNIKGSLVQGLPTNHSPATNLKPIETDFSDLRNKLISTNENAPIQTTTKPDYFQLLNSHSSMSGPHGYIKLPHKLSNVRTSTTSLPTTTHLPLCQISPVSYNVSLYHGKGSGYFFDQGIVKNAIHCGEKCCHFTGCDIAFMLKNRCFAVKCKSSDVCKLVPAEGVPFTSAAVFVTQYLTSENERTDIDDAANKNVRLAHGKSQQQLDGSIQNLVGLEKLKTPITSNNLKQPFNPTPTSEPTLASHFPTKQKGKTTIIKHITQFIENMRKKEQEELEQALVKNLKNLDQNNQNLRLTNNGAMHNKINAMTGNGKSTMPSDSDINTIKKTMENLNNENQLNHMLNDLLEKYQKETEILNEKNNAYYPEETYTTPSTTEEPTKHFNPSPRKTLDFEKKEVRIKNKDQHNLENLKNATELNEFIEQNIGRINDDTDTVPTTKLKMTKAKSNNTRDSYFQQPTLHYHMKLLKGSKNNKIQTGNQNNDYKKGNNNPVNDSYARHAILHYHLKLLNGSETLSEEASTKPPTLTIVSESKFTATISPRTKAAPTKTVTSRTKSPQTTAMITLLKNHNSGTSLKMQSNTHSNNHSTISPDSINFSIQPPLGYEIPDSINYMADPNFINISDNANLTNHIENNDFITAGSVQLNQLDDNTTDPTLPYLENSGNIISETISPTEKLISTSYNQDEIFLPGLQTQEDNQNGVIGNTGSDTSTEGNFSQTLTQQEPTQSMTQNPTLQEQEPTENEIALPDVKDPDTEPEPDRNITQLTLLQHQQVKTNRPHFDTKTYVLNFPTIHVTTLTPTELIRETKPTQPAFRIPTKNSTKTTLKIKEDPVNKLKHKLENILENKKGKYDNETEILEVILESIKKKQSQHENLNNSIEQKITYDSTPNSISLLPTMPQRAVTKSKTTRKDVLKTASLTKTTTSTLQTIPPTTILPQTTTTTSSNINTTTTTSTAATRKPPPTVEKTTKILTSPNINIIIQPATLSRETNTNPPITGELGVSSSPLQTADNKHPNLVMDLEKQQEQQREQSQHLMLELQEQLLLEQQKKEQERQETLQHQLLKQQQLQIQQDEQQAKQLLQEQMKLKQFREQLQKLAQEKQQKQLLQKQLLEKQLQLPTQRPKTNPINIQNSSLLTDYTNSSHVGNTSKPKVSENVVNEKINNISKLKVSSKFKNRYRKNNSSNNLVDELLRDGSIFKDKLKTGIYSNKLIDELLSDMTDNEKRKHEQQKQLEELEELQKLKQPQPLQIKEHHLQQLQQLEELQRQPNQNRKQFKTQQAQLQQQYQLLPFQPNQLQYPVQLQQIGLQNPMLQLQAKKLQQLRQQQNYQALQQQQQPEMQQQYMLLPMLNKQLEYLKNLQQLKLLNPELHQQNKQFLMQEQNPDQQPIDPQLEISGAHVGNGKEILKQLNPIQDLVDEDSDQSPQKISKIPFSTTQTMPTRDISKLQSEENVSKNNKDLFIANSIRNPWPYYDPKMKDVLVHLKYQGTSESNGKYHPIEKLVNEDETDEPKTVNVAENFLNEHKSLKYLKQLENLNLENYRNLNSLRKEPDAKETKENKVNISHYGTGPNWNQSYTEETDGTEQVINSNYIVALGSTNSNDGKTDHAHHAQSLPEYKGSELNSSMYIFDYGNPTKAPLSKHVEKYVTEDQDMDHENKIFRVVPLSSQLIYPQSMNFNYSNQNGNLFNASKVYSPLNSKIKLSKKPKVFATTTPKPSHLEESPILDLSQDNSSESIDTDHIDSDDPLAKTIFKITNKPKTFNKTTIIENEPVIVLNVNNKQTKKKENKLENIEKQKILPEESPDITLDKLHNLTAVNAYKKSSQQNKNSYVLDTTKEYGNLTKKAVKNSTTLYNATIKPTGISQKLASKINDKFDVNKTKKHNNYPLIEIKQFCFYGKTQYNVTLRGGLDAGIYVDNGNVNNSSECAKLCCEEESCDLAFMIVDRCFSVRCYNYSSCDTVKPKVKHYRTYVIFVKRNIKTKSTQTVSLLQSLYETTENIKITTGILNLNQTRQQNHSKITYDETFNRLQSTTGFVRTNTGKNLTTLLQNKTSTDTISIKHSTNNVTEDSHVIQKEKQLLARKTKDESATTRNMINYSPVNNNKKNNDSRSFPDLSESTTALRTDSCLNTVFESDLSFKNGFDTGIFTKRGKTQNSSDCIHFCCFDRTCDAAFMINDFCYSVKCHQGKCLTEKSKKPNFHVKIAFVNQVQELYKKSEIVHHEQKDPISNLFKTDGNSTVNSPTESFNENNQIDTLTKEIFRLEQKLDNTTLNKRLNDLNSELYTTLKPTRLNYNTDGQLLRNVKDDRAFKRAQFYAARGIKEGTAVDFGAAEADLDTWDKGRPSVGSQKHIELDSEQQHTIFGKNSYQDRLQIEPDFLDDSTKTYVNDDKETNRVSDETNSPALNENIHAATKNNVNHYKDTNDDILQIDPSILHHEDNYDVNDVTNSGPYKLQTDPDNNHLKDKLNSHHVEERGNDVKDLVGTETGGMSYFFNVAQTI